MSRTTFPLAAMVAVLGVSVFAQDEGAMLKSGPQPGALLPGSFAPLNLNGKIAKGRHHCLVCEFGLTPTVLVFARDPGEGKDAALNELLAQLDKAVDRHEISFLNSFVVFLSGDARSSITDPDVEDPARLVEEATVRKALIERLKPRAQALKNVVVTVYAAEGPKEYNLNPEAEVTVLFYSNHKVLANYAFAEGGMTEADADAILRTVDRVLTEEPADS